MNVIIGKWPPRDCPFNVNGNTRTLLYYLVDGSYLRFAFFVAPYPDPQTREQRTFNRLQEALYKDVERLFKMLTARFRIMLHPCRYRSVPRMVLTTQTVAMLHNMVVECRRNRFFSRSRSSVYGKGSGGELGEGAAGAAQADGADGEGGGADAGAAAGTGATGSGGGAADAGGAGGADAGAGAAVSGAGAAGGPGAGDAYAGAAASGRGGGVVARGGAGGGDASTGAAGGSGGACGGISLDSDDTTLRPVPEGAGRELPRSAPRRGLT